MNIVIQTCKIVLLLLTFSFIGCASNPGIININFPVKSSIVPKNNQYVIIRSVTDSRNFQNDPSSLETPTYTYKKVKSVSSVIKKQTIGIKRNVSGIALDDIHLIETQNTESVIREALELSFTNQGYTIINSKTLAKKPTIIIDARINQFWEYMHTKSFKISMYALISVDLIISENQTDFINNQTITVKANKQYQVANKANWNHIIAKAIDKFISQLSATISLKKD